MVAVEDSVPARAKRRRRTRGMLPGVVRFIIWTPAVQDPARSRAQDATMWQRENGSKREQQRVRAVLRSPNEVLQQFGLQSLVVVR